MLSSRVKHFFQAVHSDESLLVTAKETTFLYHAAIYEQFFKSSDCKLWASFQIFNLNLPLQEQNVKQ